MNKINLLQKWYECHCDGDWEHEYGIEISTLDNPGWCVKIDLTDTVLDDFTHNESGYILPNDWYEIKTEENVFCAYGDNKKLEFLISCFFENFFDKHIEESNFIFKVYAPIYIRGMKFWRPLFAKMISLGTFLLIQKPPLKFTDLKSLDVESFEKISALDVFSDSSLEPETVVECELLKFFDYPSLAIREV